MKIIWLSDKIHYVKVDDDMYEELTLYRWHYNTKNNKIGYAQTKIFDQVNNIKRTVQMHRYVMGIPFDSPHIIDHIDRNGLNNQRHNLQFCTIAENALNRLAKNGAASKYKGVKLNNNPYKKWISSFGINYKMYFIKCCYTEEAAALTYDDYVRKHLKSSKFITENSCCFNFPNITEEKRVGILKAEKDIEFNYLKNQQSIYRNVVLAPKNNNGIILWRARKPYYLDNKRGMLGDYMSEIDGAMAVDYFIIRNNAENHCKLNFEYTEDDIRLIKSGERNPPKSYKEFSRSLVGVKKWHRGSWRVFLNDKEIGIYKNALDAANAYDDYISDNDLDLPLNFGENI